MSTQKSVRLSDSSVEIIKSVCKDGVNFNGAINSILERYQILIADVMPELSKYEKLAIAQCFNGTWYDFSIPMSEDVKRLPWLISEAVRHDENVASLLWEGSDSDHEDFEKFAASGELDEFVNKVQNWSHAERMAVIHYGIEFWAKRGGSELGLVQDDD